MRFRNPLKPNYAPRGVLRLLVGATCLGVAATAGAQAFPPPIDNRYGTPPSGTAETSTAASNEPLIVYRRDEAQTAGIAADANVAMPTQAASASDANPLRKSPEPPAKSPFTELPPSTPAGTASANPAPATPFAPSPPAQPPAETAAAMTATAPDSLPRYDGNFAPAAFQADATAAEAAAAKTPQAEAIDDPLTRRLAAPSDDWSKSAASAEAATKTAARPFAFSKLESLSTAGAGLAIVVGLFIVCMFLLRRGGAKTAGALPGEAFAVLGRAPLTAQSFAHLLRIGNKLVLVAVTADGAQPLTEVTDPMEVDRLTGLCASGRGFGPAAEFQQVLAQLAREPARGFLGGEASSGAGRRRG